MSSEIATVLNGRIFLLPIFLSLSIFRLRQVVQLRVPQFAFALNGAVYDVPIQVDEW